MELLELLLLYHSYVLVSCLMFISDTIAFISLRTASEILFEISLICIESKESVSVNLLEYILVIVVIIKKM